MEPRAWDGGVEPALEPQGGAYSALVDKQLRTAADKMAVPMEKVVALATDPPGTKARRAYNAVIAMNRFAAAARGVAVSPFARHQSEPIPVIAGI